MKRVAYILARTSSPTYPVSARLIVVTTLSREDYCAEKPFWIRNAGLAAAQRRLVWDPCTSTAAESL